MPDAVLYPRFAERRLTEALADSPAVLIHGPRQSGKTTLAQIVGRPAAGRFFGARAGLGGPRRKSDER